MTEMEVMVPGIERWLGPEDIVFKRCEISLFFYAPKYVSNKYPIIMPILRN